MCVEKENEGMNVKQLKIIRKEKRNEHVKWVQNTMAAQCNDTMHGLDQRPCRVQTVAVQGLGCGCVGGPSGSKCGSMWVHPRVHVGLCVIQSGLDLL